MPSVDPSLHDRFFLVQRIRPMVNQYEVSTLGADEKSAGEPVCFVEQRRMKLKEDLRAFADDSKTTEVFRIKAQQIWDPRARYDVTDPSGQQVGQLRKVFGTSLLRSTWRIYDAAGNESGWARERNLFVALFRRFVGFIPFVGGFADWVPIPYHFDYFAGDRRIGGLERILGLRDRYASMSRATRNARSTAGSCSRWPWAWTLSRPGSRCPSSHRLPPLRHCCDGADEGM